MTVSMSRSMVNFEDFRQTKIDGYLQTLNRLELVAISGLIRNTECEEKLTRYAVLLLYTNYNKLIQQNIK